jgi:hypothetical protein
LRQPDALQAVPGGHWLTVAHGAPAQKARLIALQKKQVVPDGQPAPGGKDVQSTTDCSARQRHCVLGQSSGTHRQSGPPLKHVDPVGQVPSHVGYEPPLQKFTCRRPHRPPVDTQVSSGAPTHGPLHAGAVAPPQGGSVVVVVGPQPFPHASQQLAHAPGLPPRAAHEPASREIRQRGDPSRGTQHETAPDLPHVDFDAHRLTVLRHCRRSCPVSTRVRSTTVAQRT